MPIVGVMSESKSKDYILTLNTSRTREHIYANGVETKKHILFVESFVYVHGPLLCCHFSSNFTCR